jgi:hypothetical protein
MPDYNYSQGSEAKAAVLLALIDDSPLGAQEKLDIAHSGQTVAELRAHCLAHMRSDAVARIQGELRAGQASAPSIGELVACIRKLAVPVAELQTSLRGMIESLNEMENLISGVGIGSRAARRDDYLTFPISNRDRGGEGTNGRGEGGAQQPFSLFAGPTTDRYGRERTRSPSSGLLRGKDELGFGVAIDEPGKKYVRPPRPYVEKRRAFQGGGIL